MFRGLFLAFLGVFLGSTQLGAQVTQGAFRPLMRISVENTATHFQAKAVAEFARILQVEAGDQLEVEFHHSAELYRDSQVVQAMILGKVEMAVPGTWQLGNFVPEMGVFLLPEFYGRDYESIYAALNSENAGRFNARIEQLLQVKIPGNWLDLGFAHVFTTRAPILGPQGFQGRRIRVAGGVGNEARINLLGAQGISIPWPDFPLQLETGNVDGVLTTMETIRSARLWEKGIRYVYQDFQYFPQYVPMISASFWNSLDPPLQQIILDAWQRVSANQRLEARVAQEEARIILEENGIQVITPDARTLEETRDLLMENRSVFLDQMGLQGNMDWFLSEFPAAP